MAPTPAEITSMLENVFQGGSGVAGMIQAQTQRGQDIVHPELKFTIAGKDHPLACDVEGSESTKNHLSNHVLPKLMAAVDESKPMKTEVIRVIGGGSGSEYAAVELISSGTSKKGKPWHHESVSILRFDANGKIVEAKGYFDTHYLHNQMSGY